MVVLRQFLNCAVAAFLGLGFGSGAMAQTPRLDELLSQLAQPELPNWQVVEDEIWQEWQKSGSPAMDLLLQRAQKAMEEQDYEGALDHLGALIDHAPDFAEAYNARGSAFFQLGMIGPAMADVAKTLTLNPKHFGALTGLGAILEETGHGEQALNAYRAAHAIHPHQPELKDAIERLEAQVSGIDI